MEGVAICDYCHNIQEWKKFNAPKDYLACIEYIQQLVTNGGFELLEEESTCPLNQVETEDGWADEIMVHGTVQTLWTSLYLCCQHLSW